MPRSNVSDPVTVGARACDLHMPRVCVCGGRAGTPNPAAAHAHTRHDAMHTSRVSAGECRPVISLSRPPDFGWASVQVGRRWMSVGRRLMSVGRRWMNVGRWMMDRIECSAGFRKWRFAAVERRDDFVGRWMAGR